MLQTNQSVKPPLLIISVSHGGKYHVLPEYWHGPDVLELFYTNRCKELKIHTFVSITAKPGTRNMYLAYLSAVAVF